MGGMSRRQYRRNGTPIGKYKVYALVFKRGEWTQSYEIIPSGIEFYDDLDFLVEMEAMSGRFGYGYDRIVITRPGVDLGGAKLMDVDMAGSNLSGANLKKAKLEGAELIGVDLSGADLSGADMLGVRMEGAVLSGSKLIGTYMERVKLVDVKIDGTTDFSMAYLPDGPVPFGWDRDKEGVLSPWKSRRRR